MASYPSIFRVRQTFPRPLVENVPETVASELKKLNLGKKIQAGQTVAITAGSRGIANIAVILKAVVDHVKSLGATPFLVPAMGSHGGGTAEGQVGVLATYGITEEYCGCEIRASMDTVIVCQAAEGFPVHFDKHAHGADHVLVCNRIKPHTNFRGDVESGLMKMMLIGLGKHAGAKIYHRAILDYDFGQIIRSVAKEVLENCSIVAGLAIVENGYDQTAHIRAVASEELVDRERELLVTAKELMPRLPFREAHLLLIDEIGKNISGSGLDTNVVGRKGNDHAAGADEWPKIRNIVIRDLTPQTHGNAAGIGIAEYCRTQVVEKMNVAITRINCLTGGHATGAMLPLDYATDREILDAALPSIGLAEPPDAKMLWVRNTLDVAEVECSAAYYEEARSRSDLEILTEPRALPWDDLGNLPKIHTFR
ncbi:[Fe-S]-binding protein [Lignipirellula cremea]|uniref:LarA-like N-terminal domain-containing protein n=1 Tax=Lignipirellula cremea TaxID=2528010 RepID=A0A518DXY2_9BACT|nr:[Fe-S]-binding protein [Lignipirellula cremea]QDU96694.1 hypothetical protein Pla8534_45150 [Lignipirellula cremea]